MTATLDTPARTEVRPWGRIVCAAAALATVAPFALSQLTGDSGASITGGLLDDATLLMTGSLVAVLVAAGLFVAAARLGRSLTGDAATVATAAGSAVALMYACYYAVFGAGGVVAAQMLDNPGAGLGESAALLLNVMEIGRYAPTLALVAVVWVAGARFGRGWVRITAAVLTVLTVVPFTSWVAAALVPAWLGAVAATVRD